MKNTIEYNGYRATIVQDDSPANPFEEWDCEPPLIVYYDGRLTTYQGAPESLREIVNLLPASTWERGNRVPLIREYLNCSLREFAECTRDEYGNTRDTFAHLLSEQVGATPSGWRDALAWFETASALLTLAGIPHHYGQSDGYCQGHSSLVLALATPEWVAKVGAPADTLKAQCKGAFDLYGQWAWGDVYGVAEITDPQGDEVEDGSVWGFYGSDHEASGLMDHVRSTCDRHAEKQAETATELASALCTMDG